LDRPLGEAAAQRRLRDGGAEIRFSAEGADGPAVGVSYPNQTPCFDEATFSLLEQLPLLKTLDMTGAVSSSDPLRHIVRLPDLESLTLRRASVGDDAMRYLVGLGRLRHLDLAGANVSDAGLAHLAALTDLQCLDLTATRLTEAGTAHLSNFKCTT
jgi:hypothetical protein